ncbi:hypothetical protein [Salipiger mucosus]|uniref:Uncharacterized protein n=1 Tax=Salipiger mucosus DSM 16094 TaxID=1123237 RepID=S9QVA0_9RHOB|nr:hypothetical protein [Salipiger mucosus]EPX83492.1 hypothetical protein Salmuc_02100 [Salipiger mucosus DSM 16094]
MAEKDGITRRFGYVAFDNEGEPADGFASVAGQPAKRISSIYELPTDVIWWTNITFDAFYKKSDAWRSPWLRHDKYLVVSPKDVLKEWGMNPTDADVTTAAPIISEFFSRVMQMSFRLIRDVDPRSRMEDVFVGRFLREDLRCVLPEAEYPKSEAATVIKSGNAWQEFTQTGVSPVRGGRWVMLRRPRVSYAQEMFHTPIPRGPFEFYGRSEIRSVAKDKMKWVLDNNNPCIAEVTVNRIDGDIAPIYGFGNAMEKEKRIARSWVAHPELVVMDHFTEIDVKSLYMGSEYDLIGPNLPEPVKDFLSSKYTEISWSAGVVAETLWRACALGEEKSKVQGQERAHTSWQGVWIKGADKANMFLTAMQLAEKGYSVVSYGLGWVRAAVLEEDIPDLIRHGLSLGLLPQVSDLPKGLFSHDRKVPWQGGVGSMALAQFTLTGNRDLLWGMDTIPLLGRKQRKQTFMELMKKHGGG